MNLNNRRIVARANGRWALALAVAIALYGSGAHAQQADAPSEQAKSAPATGAANANQGLQKVVVTAQFRRQSLESAPVAMSVETGSMIQARSQTDITSIGLQAPNVTISPGGQGFGNSASIYIRGIGQGDANPAEEPGVGLYIDDVYFPTVFGTLFSLMDLDRIQILRGPQGTSEGMNSLGGSVRLYSVEPNANTGASVEATTGSLGRIGMRGVLDVAVIPEKLFLRVAALSDRRNGYETRYDYGCAHPGSGVPTFNNNPDCVLGTLGGINDQALRAQLRWVPTASVDVNLSEYFMNDDDEPQAQTLLYAGPGGPSNVINGKTYTLGPQYVPTNLFYSYGTFEDPVDGKVFSPFSTTKLSATTGTVDWKISDSLDLKSITAYLAYSGQSGYDQDDSFILSSDQEYYYLHHQFTQELRLNGNVGKAIDYTVGGFYLNSITYASGEIDLTPGVLDFMQHDLVPLKSYAEFLTVTWHITDKLDVSGGVRHSEFDKTYTFGRFNPSGTAPPENALILPLNGTSATALYTHNDYRLEADYHWTSNLMSYVSWSTGFKGGGVNPRPYVAAEEVPFGPETESAYEVGLKSLFFDRRVRINLALFHDNYDAIQEGTTYCPGVAPEIPCDDIINGGKGVTEGAEAELQARPVSALEIDASASYLDFYYTSIPAATGLTYYDTLPYAPKFRGSLGIQYTIGLGSLGSLIPRLDAAYQDHMYVSAETTPVNRMSGYTALNGRLTWNPNARWQAALFVTNLTNRAYLANQFPSSTGFVEGTPAQPREWGLTVRRNFNF